MLRKTLLPFAALLLSGCGYHFTTNVDAYDLMPRTEMSKRIQIVTPDESIQSRVYASTLGNGLRAKGFLVTATNADYLLKFKFHNARESVQYNVQPVTGVVGYVVDNKSSHSDKKGKKTTEYEYTPVEGVVGTEITSQSYFLRQFDVRIYPAGNEKREVMNVTLQSNVPIASDAEAYTAMINTLTEMMDAPLRSGNYLSVIRRD
ncbi:hypothetical protein [Buttiauxella gaviniae]|uniref:hypothetical protein n=1 Tax=Buttiauxella gaviniae TaxID=82990 RepID=UPI003C71D1DE